MSPVQTVLMVMAPSDLRDRLAVLMDRLGINVITETTLHGAVEALRCRRPDAIISGLKLDDARDADVVEALRKDLRGALIPLVVAAETIDAAARIRLFELGVDDVTDARTDEQELGARMRMMLKRYRRLGAVMPEAESVDRKKVSLLQAWAADPADVLKPVPAVASPLGYTYPKAQEHFACAAGAEIAHLEDLATRMCLERRFFDRIRLCPECSHHAINFRQVAPKSKSPDISRVDVLRHFACGHLAPVKDFVSGLDYVCPRCEQQLRHVGEDYERIGEANIDNATGETFDEPETECVCLACGFVTTPDALIARDIHAYAMGERGLLAAEIGYLYDVSLDAVLMDYDLQIYTPSYLMRQLGIELERARRYRHHLGLALLRLDQYEGFLEHYGHASQQYLAQVAGCLKANTRSSDLIARHERNSVVLAFPETDLEGTRSACEKLRNEVLKLRAPRPDVQLTVSCGISAYPETADSEKALFATASECYAKAHAMGGNIVVVPAPSGPPHATDLRVR